MHNWFRRRSTGYSRRWRRGRLCKEEVATPPPITVRGLLCRTTTSGRLHMLRGPLRARRPTHSGSLTTSCRAYNSAGNGIERPATRRGCDCQCGLARTFEHPPSGARLHRFPRTAAPRTRDLSLVSIPAHRIPRGHLPLGFLVLSLRPRPRRKGLREDGR